MANTKQSKKRIRSNEGRRVVNKARLSRIKGLLRLVEEAISAGNPDQAKAALREAQPHIHRGVGWGLYHKNNAARKISRLSARIKKIAS